MPIPLLVVTKSYQGQRFTCGDNPLLRPTGIQIASKRYATLQAMAPTDIKKVHQTSLLHNESSLDRLGLLSPTYDQCSQQQSGQIALQPVLINKSKFLKVTHRTKIRQIEIREIHGGRGLELAKPVREPASCRPKPCESLKKPHECCPFAAPCGPRRKKNDRGQTSAFSSETSRFTSLIHAPRDSALPWLVGDRAALRLRRIWCVPTR